MENYQSSVIEIIEKALLLESGILKEDSDSENTEGWDSLGQLSILVDLCNLNRNKRVGRKYFK